ncbi:MAG: GNAT family N-acetyltransferase [Anaerolineae bacterium]|nr:GNAT family N-acetyltransferase [Anaerolineae bacterium]
MTPDANSLTLRPLSKDELHLIAHVDRSEEIFLGYRLADGRLVSEKVERKKERWDEAQVERFRLRALDQLERGGQAVGAFDGDRLVGFAVLGPTFRGPRQDYLHLDLLYVTRSHRRMGVASRLMQEIERLARERGARRLYISATPSESAIAFYFSRGAHLAPEPDPELHAMEPLDIPLMLEL